MLSPLQDRLRKLVAHLPEADTVALAGGAALIVRGVVDRSTRDLDFFATTPEGGQPTPTAIGETAHQGRLRGGAGSGQRRFRTTRCLLRIGHDHDRPRLGRTPLPPPDQTEAGPVLSGEELAADKLLALFGRAAARDFIDVAALLPHYGLQRLCELAAEKDPGFDRSVLADMLASFDRLPRDDFKVDDKAFGRLRSLTIKLRQQLLLEIDAGLGRKPGRNTPSSGDRSQPKDRSPGLEL